MHKRVLSAGVAMVAGMVLATLPDVAQAGKKVTICHRPPGNPTDAHTISVGEDATGAHLGHGDQLGECLSGCLASASICDDGNRCTSDACLPSGQCEHTPVDCDDGNPCTTDVCEQTTGCLPLPASGVACDDGNACTSNDTCAETRCVGRPLPGCCSADADCNDANLCTVDSCVDSTCRNQVRNCSVADSCLAGFCDPATGNCSTTRVTCNDSNVCTDDMCDPTIGCFFCPTARPPESPETSCDDGADNDCDGAVDSSDSDCAIPPPPPPPPPLPECGIHPPANHLLVAEVKTGPTTGEFVEIHNPTSVTIDLSAYIIFNATFPGSPGPPPIPACRYFDVMDDWLCANARRDFAVQFPLGSTIGPGEYQVIALTGAFNYCQTYFPGGGCSQPTYEIPPPAADSAVANMRGSFDAAGDTFTTFGFLSAASEELVLFRWDGVGSTVQDVDYVVWGTDTSVRTDKTTVAGYQADTPIAAQIPLPGSISSNASYQRACLNEGDETKIGGNGITGHDETSEDLARTWVVAAPTPAGTWRP